MNEIAIINWLEEQPTDEEILEQMQEMKTNRLQLLIEEEKDINKMICFSMRFRNFSINNDVKVKIDLLNGDINENN